MNKLRSEIQSMLSETECRRPPALRRSRKEEWLYATDLPKTAGKEAVSAFLERANEAGWITENEGDWIQLDRKGLTGNETDAEGGIGPEAECCLSLLLRHMNAEKRSADREKRMLLKAREEGADAFEKVCERLHREWAGALRRGEKLPAVETDFFIGRKEKC